MWENDKLITESPDLEAKITKDYQEYEIIAKQQDEPIKALLLFT